MPTNENSEVEKLVSKLQENIAENEPFLKSDLEVIADFIIADRARIHKEYEVIKEKAWKYDELCK